METSFWHSSKQLRIVQDIVKRYDGRFLNNPLQFVETSYIVVSFEDGDNYKQFCAAIQIIKEPFF